MVTHAELRSLGLSGKEIWGLVRRGILHRLFHGVYAYGNRVLRDNAYLYAALASCPGEAFLTGDAGEAAYGFRRLYRKEIEITIPRAGGRRDRGPLKLHNSRHVLPGDVTVRDGLRVASFPRLLLDQASRKSPAHLEKLLEKSVRRQVYDAKMLEAAFARHAGRPGTAIARAASRRYLPGPDRKSELERAWDRWKHTRPDIPEPQRNVHLLGWEIDCLWPEQKVALELDGRPYHVAVRDFDKDSVKQNELLVGGYRPMRVTDFRWEYDRARVVRHLELLLGLLVA